MKHYKLKKWYPSLHKDWVVGDVVIPWEKQKDYYHVPNKSTTVFKEEVENNPDFWELVKEPLFITEDGVEMFDENAIIIAVGKDMDKLKVEARFHGIMNCVFFKHETNANEYIWRNKRLFSYEDFMRWGNAPYERVIRELAMERSGQA